MLIDKNQPILEQADAISSQIALNAGSLFSPEHVEAFTELAWREQFWLDIVSPSLEEVIVANSRHYSVELDNDDLLAHLIDFRSPFTATHSSGVATVASILANLIGFSASECQKIQVAGYLHDIGKLAVPNSLLNKPARLSRSEFRVMKSHAYYTHRILEPLRGIEDIALHHERFDGNGYPGRLMAHNIPLGARIIAVADVFTALLEPRPYRRQMSKEAVLSGIDEMVRRNLLDKNVVAVLRESFDAYRCQAQNEAALEYARFRAAIDDAKLPN